MNLRRIPGSAAAALMLLGLCACDGAPLSGPPQLRLGRDECRECGMLISEERCAAALLLERAGRREYAMFDDLGCLLDVERDGLDGALVLERYVHDHATRQWLDASQAVFLLADPDKLATPMSSGMVAFTDPDDARAAQDELGGELLDLPGLAAARQAWSDARRTAASRPGG